MQGVLEGRDEPFRARVFAEPALQRTGPNGILVTLSAAHFLVPVGTKLIFGFAERTLGGQEGAEFVNWMHEMDARDRDVATHGDFDQLRADIAELRHEMQVGFATVETRFERRVGDLIKWSFVFWVGAVAAIAMLARALR